MEINDCIIDEVDFISYYVETNFDGSPKELENHRWLLEEILDGLKRVNKCNLTDGRKIEFSYLIDKLEKTLKEGL